jgi:anti-anti-sigma regulatory factor
MEPTVATIIQMPVDGDHRLVLTIGHPWHPSNSLRPFSITRKISADNARMLVNVGGYVDAMTTRVLTKVLALARQDTRSHPGLVEIVVDMRRVVHLGAAGFEALSRAHLECAEDGIGFQVIVNNTDWARSLAATDRPEVPPA